MSAVRANPRTRFEFISNLIIIPDVFNLSSHSCHLLIGIRLNNIPAKRTYFLDAVVSSNQWRDLPPTLRTNSCHALYLYPHDNDAIILSKLPNTLDAIINTHATAHRGIPLQNPRCTTIGRDNLTV